MHSKSICLVSDTIYDLNGVSRFIQDFSKEALAQNKKFYVIGSTYKKPLENINNIYNLKPLFKTKMPFYKSLDLVFPSFFRIHRKIKELDPDVICISTPGFVGLAALISAKILKKRLIGIYHTDFSAYIYKNTKSILLKNISKFFLKQFYKPFNTIYSRSHEYKEQIIKELKCKREKIDTFKAGIDLKRFDNIQKTKKDKFRLLYVGRLSKEKNINFLLNIMNKLYSKNIELYLVGDMELKLDTKTLENKNIFYMGKQTGIKLINLYSSSDLFIFPSTTDTLGQVVIEAMASSLPVLVTNTGGPKELVNDSCGFILDINKQEQWCEKINLLAQNKKLHEIYSFNAKKQSLKYSINSSFEEFWDKNTTSK